MGFTRSVDFPVTPGAFDTTANGAFDLFVAKLNAAGSNLVYATYLGGADFDSGGGLAIDGAGNAYVSGATASLNFPTTAGALDTHAGWERCLRDEVERRGIGARVFDRPRRDGG